MMQRFILFTLLMITTAAATQPTAVDEWELRKRTASGYVPYGVTAENGKAIGFTAGVPAMIAVGGTSELSTSTVVTGITSGYALYNNGGVLGGLNLAATYQPLDSDLTSIAALTTTSYGRGLLTTASDEALSLSLTSVYNVKNYGAVGDARKVEDAVTSTATNSGGSTTVTTATPAFTANDNNKVVWVCHPSSHSTYVPAGIATFVDASTITVSQLATTDGTALSLVIGTDDTAAFNAAEAAAIAAERATIAIPAGGYIIRERIFYTASNSVAVAIIGAGTGDGTSGSGAPLTTLYMAPDFTTDPVGSTGEVIHRAKLVRGLNIDGVWHDFTGTGANAVLNNCLHVEDVHAEAYGYSTILYNSLGDAKISSGRFAYGSGFGIYTANSCDILGTYTGNNTGYGIGIVNTSGVRIALSVLDECDTNSLYISNSTDVSVSQSTIYGGPSNYGAVLESAAEASFSQCVLEYYTGRTDSGGLDVKTGTTAKIASCRFKGNGTRYGLNIAGTCYDVGGNIFGGTSTMNGSLTYGATASVPASKMPAFTGDITTSAGATATTLATVNSNVGSFTNASITVNAKGLITAASSGSAGISGSTGGTDNAILRADGTGGATVQNSVLTVNDTTGTINNAVSGTNTIMITPDFRIRTRTGNFDILDSTGASYGSIVTGVVTANATTDPTAMGQGAFIVGGGATIAKQLFVGTKLTVGGELAGAKTSTKILKSVTAIADATATDVLTVTVPNAAHSGTLRVTLTGSLGAGGAIGANEATGSISYDFAIARTAGVATVVGASTAYGSTTASVAGGATITITAAASGMTGAVGATQTFTVQATITKGSGSSAAHTCVVNAEIINANATGITIQ